MAMVDLDLSAMGIQEVISDLNATEQQTERALKSTLVKMAAWLKTRSIRGLSQALEIQQKLLRRRLKTFKLRKSGDGQSITVWYGLDQIALIYMRPKKRARGVSADGNRYVPGGFIAKGRNGAQQVFKRRGKERLPLDKETAAIQDQANTFLEDKLIGAQEFETQFMKVFERELKWRTR
ncbi:phage tail protein [Tardiphaga sp. 20_F10_N6_6]|uniref:phage tail protein n=1 Tax=Tardiphaga sp. 20_F10_N6_6 TaxID=3240788 RepID=UPI003F89FC5C